MPLSVDINTLHNLLHTLYEQPLSPEDRRELEQRILALKHDATIDEAASLADPANKEHSDVYIRWFALSSLRTHIEFAASNPNQTSDSNVMQLTNTLLTILPKFSGEPYFVSAEAIAAIVTAAAAPSFSFPDIIRGVMQLLSASDTALMALRTVEALSEECQTGITAGRGRLPPDAVETLRKRIGDVSDEMYPTLGQVLDTQNDEETNTDNLSNDINVVTSVLRTTGSLLAWTDLGSGAESVLHAILQYTAHPHPSAAAAAVTALTHVLSRSFIPREADQFLEAVVQSLVYGLRRITSGSGNDNDNDSGGDNKETDSGTDDADEELTGAVCHAVAELLDGYLARLPKDAQHTVIATVVAATQNAPHPIVLAHILPLWSPLFQDPFADLLSSESETVTSSVRSVLERVLRSGRWASHWDEDEGDPESRDNLLVEVQTVLDDAADSLPSIALRAVLDPVEWLLNHLHARPELVLADLELVLRFGEGVVTTAAHLGHLDAVAVRLLLHTVHRLLDFGAHTSPAPGCTAMAAAYRCVGAAMPWAAHVEDAEMQHGFVRDVVECAVRCLEEGKDVYNNDTNNNNVSPDKKQSIGQKGVLAMQAAADMLTSLTQVAQPRDILDCHPFRALIEESRRLYAILPIHVHATIAQAVAAALLLPYPTPQHLSADAWQQTRNEALHSFVEPIVSTFSEYMSRQTPFSPSDMARIVHLTAGLVQAAEHAPPRRRRHLHGEIQTVVEGLPSLPQVCDVGRHPTLFDAIVVLLDRTLATLRFSITDDLLSRTLELVLSAATPEYLSELSNSSSSSSNASDSDVQDSADLPIHVIDLLAAVAADKTAPGLSEILNRAANLAACRPLPPDIRAAALRVLPTAMDIHWTSHFFTSNAADDAQPDHKDDVYLVIDTLCAVLSIGTDLQLFRTGLEAVLTLHHRRQLLHRPVAVYVLSPKMSPTLLQALFSGEFDLLRDVIAEVFIKMAEVRDQATVWGEVREAVCYVLNISEVPSELEPRLENVPQDLDGLRRHILTLAQDVVLFNR